MEKKLVSIIVPVYKVEKYLRKCVDSILAQTYKNLEIILVDDGSPDACPAICDEYARLDKRIKVIHKLNGGVSSARNAGLNAATGEYIQFVDSDDWIEKDCTQKLLQGISGYDISICGFKKIMKKNKLINVKTSVKINDLENEEQEFIKLINNNMLHAPWNKMYLKKLIGELKFDEVIVYGEDSVFNFRYFEKCRKIISINESLYNYNCTLTNSATKRFSLKIFDDIKKKFETQKIFFENIGFSQSMNLNKCYFIKSSLMLLVILAKSREKDKISKLKKIVNDKMFQQNKESCNQFLLKTILFLIKLRLYRLILLILKLKKI